MPKSKSKPSSKLKSKPKASPSRKYLAAGLLASAPLVIIAIAFVLAPKDGSYFAETPAGRVIVERKVAALPATPTTQGAELTPAPMAQSWGVHDLTLLGPNNSADRTGAAIHISPSAVGSTNTNMRVIGFERALVDEGKFSRIDRFEAYRSPADVPGLLNPPVATE